MPPHTPQKNIKKKNIQEEAESTCPPGGRRLAHLYHELHLPKRFAFTPVSTFSRLRPHTLLPALARQDHRAGAGPEGTHTVKSARTDARPARRRDSARVHVALQWTGSSSPQSKGAERSGSSMGSLSFVCHYVYTQGDLNVERRELKIRRERHVFFWQFSH